MEKTTGWLLVENFPEGLRRQLKVKAALEGTTMRGLVIAACEAAVGKARKRNP